MEQPRLNYAKVAPEGYKAMFGLQQYAQQSGLDKLLIELVKIRASQINGCAFCLDMHTKDARSLGETEQRIYMLNAWREAPCYSDKEKAALAWTETVTLVAQSRVPDEIYEDTRKHFGEKELVDLTFVVVTINSWNRLAISFRAEAGVYQPPTSKN